MNITDTVLGGNGQPGLCDYFENLLTGTERPPPAQQKTLPCENSVLCQQETYMSDQSLAKSAWDDGDLTDTAPAVKTTEFEQDNTFIDPFPGLPALLKKEKRWVVHCREERSITYSVRMYHSPNKIKNATSTRKLTYASQDKPETWSDYETACSVLKQEDWLDGLAFASAQQDCEPEHRITMIHLERTRDEFGNLEEKVSEIIDRFPGAYIESPAADSFCLFVLGQPVEYGSNGPQNFAWIYEDKFVPLSGKPISANNTQIARHQSGLLWLYAQGFEEDCLPCRSDDLEAVLKVVPSNNYGLKLFVCAVLKSAKLGFEAFQTWCEKSANYDALETQRIWDRAEAIDGVDHNHLIHLATMRYGFKRAIAEFDETSLDVDLPAVNLFPVEALGPTLSKAVRRSHEVSQAPLNICAISFLSAANFLAQRYVDTLVDGRTILTSMYFFLIAESGDRKSEVDRLAFGAIRNFEVEQEEQWFKDIASYRKQSTAFNIKLNMIKKDKTLTKNDIESQVQELGDPPEAPLYASLLCSDTTYEGIHKSLRNGQPAQGIISDEGGTFFGGWSMNPQNLLKTLANLSTIHERGEATRLRSSDANGPENIRGKRLMISIQMQAAVARMILTNSIFKEQGFLGRALISQAPETQGRVYKEESLTDDPAVVAHHEICSSKLAGPYTLKSGSRNDLALPKWSLTEEAKTLYMRFHDEIQREIPRGKRLAGIRSVAEKCHDNAIRTAATLAFYYGCSEITTEWMSNAISIMKWAIEERLRLEQLGPELGRDIEDQNEAVELYNWIRKKTLSEDRKSRMISRNEIRDSVVPTRFRSNEQLKKLLPVLVQQGLLVKLEKCEYRGKLTREGYSIC